MADHFGLLFQAISIEWTTLDHLIAVTAEGMAHQRKVESPAGLRLPDVSHFVDEQALEREPLPGKILGPDSTIGVEMDVAGRGHDDPLGLERPPFTADHPYPAIVDGIAKHRAGQLDFAGRKGARAFHGPKASAATPACPVSRLPLGQPKI